VNLRVPWHAEKFLIISETVNFSRRTLLLVDGYLTSDVINVSITRVMFRGRVTLCASSITVLEWHVNCTTRECIWPPYHRTNVYSSYKPHWRSAALNWYWTLWYRDADKSLAQPTSRCILFDGENISFGASLVIYINSTNIPPITIINRIYQNQNLLSL